MYRHTSPEVRILSTSKKAKVCQQYNWPIRLDFLRNYFILVVSLKMSGAYVSVCVSYQFHETNKCWKSWYLMEWFHVTMAVNRVDFPLDSMNIAMSVCHLIKLTIPNPLCGVCDGFGTGRKDIDCKIGCLYGWLLALVLRGYKSY